MCYVCEIKKPAMMNAIDAVILCLFRQLTEEQQKELITILQSPNEIMEGTIAERLVAQK